MPIVLLLKAAWGFVTSPLGKALAIGAAVLALAAGIYFKGRSDGSEQVKEQVAKAAAASVKAAQSRNAAVVAVTAPIAAALTAQKVQIQYRTQYLIKEVPTYVTPKADAACVVPTGFVSLFSGAADGTGVPPTPGGSVDADSGLHLSDVAKIGLADVGLAQAYRSEALAWRKWYPAAKAAYEGK